MEKVRPWCGQPSDRGRLKNRNRNRINYPNSWTNAYCLYDLQHLHSCFHQLEFPNFKSTGFGWVNCIYSTPKLPDRYLEQNCTLRLMPKTMYQWLHASVYIQPTEKSTEKHEHTKNRTGKRPRLQSLLCAAFSMPHWLQNITFKKLTLQYL